MFSALEKSSLDRIRFIKEMLNYHEQLSNANQEISQKVKHFSVSACVTQLYAIYEKFIEVSISDYLDVLSECVQFSDLSAKFKKEYRLGISQVLGRIDQDRYTHLEHENVIKWYYDALNNAVPYRFVTDALIRHEQNLRLDTVNIMLCNIEITDLHSWIITHPEIKSLYAEEELTYNQVESEMKNFIQLRNDASHGSLDSLEGKDNLDRLCNLVMSLVKAISSLMTKSILEYMRTNNKAVIVGKVTESFGKKGAFILQMVNGVDLKLGEILYFKNNSDCYNQTIDSMQKDDVIISSILSDKDNFELGIKCERTVKKETIVYKLL